MNAKGIHCWKLFGYRKCKQPMGSFTRSSWSTILKLINFILFCPLYLSTYHCSVTTFCYIHVKILGCPWVVTMLNIDMCIISQSQNWIVWDNPTIVNYKFPATSIDQHCAPSICWTSSLVDWVRSFCVHSCSWNKYFWKSLGTFSIWHAWTLRI